MLQVRCLSGAPNFYAPLAQSGMRRLSQKENRVGSNPTGGTTVMGQKNRFRMNLNCNQKCPAIFGALV